MPSSCCVARSLIEKTSLDPSQLLFFLLLFSTRRRLPPSLWEQYLCCLPRQIASYRGGGSQPRRSFNFAKTSAASRPELIYIFINCLSLSARLPRSAGLQGVAGKLGLIAAIEAESRLITGRASPRGAATRGPDIGEGWESTLGVREVGIGRREEGGVGVGKVCSQSVI